MNDPVLVRTGRLADIGLLADIERAAGRLFPSGRIPDPDQTYPRAALEQSENEGLLFVVEVEGEVVGFAACSRSGDRIHLDEVSVHPDHGRKGYGRALVARVLSVASEQDAVAVSLTTFADIRWNGPFYASMGFSTVPESELDTPLREALAHERDLGLTERIAMVHPVGAGAAQDD